MASSSPAEVSRRADGGGHAPSGFGHSLWSLGWPVAAQSALAAGLALVDTLMVASLGTASLAGVGLIGRYYFMLTLVLAGLSGAVAALMAVQHGAGKTEVARQVLRLGLAGSLLAMMPLRLAAAIWAEPAAGALNADPDVTSAAALFLQASAAYVPLTALTMTLAAGLRASGDTRTPLWAGVVALTLNTVLNLWLIFGGLGVPPLGVAGAGLATTLAKLVEAAWLAHALRLGRNQGLGGAALRDLWHAARSSIGRSLGRLAAPLMAKELAWSGGVFAATVLIGQLGTLPLAAFNLVGPIEGLLNCVVHGLAVAAGILLGHALGRGEREAAQALAWRALQQVSVAAALAGLACAVMVLLLWQSGLLRGAFAPGVHDLMLPTLAVVLALYGARAHNTMVSVGILRAGGDVRWLMWVDLLSMWCLNLPLVACAVMVLQWPLPAVVALMLLEEVLKLLVFRWRVGGGRWRKLDAQSLEPRLADCSKTTSEAYS